MNTQVIKNLDISEIDCVMQIESSSFDHPWLRQHFIDELAKSSSFCRGIYQNARLFGYLILSVAADEAEILDIAVSPEQRRGGFARKLLDDAVELCRLHGVKNLYLEVRMNAIPAVTLYREYGFRECGTRKNYYENGIDAILMTLEIDEVNNAV